MKIKLCLISSIIVVVILPGMFSVYAACNEGKCDNPDEYPAYLEELNKKVGELGQAKDTLSNQIRILNSQIELTTLKINQTKTKITEVVNHIDSLGNEITQLDTNLNYLTSVYINQVSQNYKLAKKYPVLSFIISDSFNSFLEQFKYQRVVQSRNRDTRYDLETNEAKQKMLLKQKQQEQDSLVELQKKLSDQNQSLSKQKLSKNNLLEITKNDEARYQKLRQEAQSELDSLKTAVFDGIKEVKKGDPIGVMGNTGYSFGPHLHFGLYNLTKDNLASFEYTNDIDVSDFLSKHQWPMKNYIITQGRGHTQYSYMYSDHFHHGIDMASTEKTIYAAEDGTAYFFKDKYPNQRTGSGNHVKLFHSDGHMTLYLHMEKFYK